MGALRYYHNLDTQLGDYFFDVFVHDCKPDVCAGGTGSSTRLSAIVKVKQIRPITATLSRPSAALSGNLAYGLSDLPDQEN